MKPLRLDRATVQYLADTGMLKPRDYLRLANARAFDPWPVTVPDQAQRQLQAPVRAYAQPMLLA